MRRAGAGRSFPAPGRVASVASAVGGSVGRCARWRGVGGRSGCAARGGAARFCLVLGCGAARAVARGGPLGFPQDARPTAAGCGVSAPVCGPEGKGKGHGDVEGEQVRARGTAEAGGSERASGREREGAATQPGRPECRLLPGAPAPRLCCLLRRPRRGFPEAWGGDTGGAGGQGGSPHRSGPGQRSWRPGTARGARCLPRGASPRRAAGLRGKRVPGGSFRRRRACSPPPGRAGGRAGTTGCTPLFFYSHSPRPPPPGPPGERGCDRNLCLQQNNNNHKPRGSSELPAPVPASRVPCPRSWPGGGGHLAASVVGAPRASVPTLPRRRSARGGRTGSRLQWDIFTLSAEDRRITHGAESQPAPVQFPMPLVGQLAGLSAEEPRSEQNSFSLSS